MLCSKVVVLLLVCLFAIVRGMPQNGGNGQDSSGLPFIQFTNGGIRFNFGGYHAAAGLGGLLGGAKAGGGLHASVGTPWGAHAGAGLGGALGGDDATAGGGLYARAGLGHGRSEVGAGLGGLLDGSGRSATPASGGLYAGAKVGDHGVGVSTSGSTGSNNPNEPSTSNAQNGGNPSKGTSNIQIISHGGKKQHKIKQALAEEAGSTETSKQVVPAASKEERDVHPVQTPPAAASVFNPLSAIPVPQTVVGGAILEAPLVPPLPNQVNEVVQLEQRPHRVKFGRPLWRVRKRVWGPTKYITINSSVESQETPQKKDRKRRQVPMYTSNRPMLDKNGVPIENDNGDHFFDDIFKIPISTLGAVNDFLKNNAS
ncbi:uncharacterized protein LOC100883691 [Megachile rotundata]|uniref:uncharacterized protein LOC100883691 n=1 Tax=Megachile rotundata TaxID=143995 RepID=UPI003FD2370C